MPHESYSQEETDLQHEKMHTVISAEIQGVQSAMSVKMEGLATKKDLEELAKLLEPVIDAYKAILLSRGFVVGLGGFVLAISAIGAGILWLINHAIGK